MLRQTTGAMNRILRVFGAADYAVTRPSDGSLRTVKLGAIPYTPESASAFQLEGDVNVGEDHPYIVYAAGTPDLQDGDQLTIRVVQRDFLYRLFNPISPPLSGGSPYTVSIAVLLRRPA